MRKASWNHNKKFDKHIPKFCNKVNKKVNALCQVTGDMLLEKRRTVMKTIVKSQFNCCPLTWMLHFFFYNNVYTKLKTNVNKNIQTYNSTPKTIYCVSGGKIKM